MIVNTIRKLIKLNIKKFNLEKVKMAALSLFDQIKTEPIQFYPSNFTTAPPIGTAILQSNHHGVIMNKNISTDVSQFFRNI